MSHGKKSVHEPTRSRLHQGFFGRMFRNLPPFDPPGSNEQNKLNYLRNLAGQMLEPNSAPNSTFDNINIPAGYTYFGQFIDHDITFDPVSRLDRQNDPEMLENFRTPRFDLDCIYARGPEDQPYLYDSDGATLLIGRNNNNEADLLRQRNERAIIGDHRNDENVIVSQIQLTFIQFHNKVVAKLKSRFNLHGRELLEEAQRIVRWHYQWVVIQDFVRRLVSGNILSSKLPPVNQTVATEGVNLSFFKWKHKVFMPIEFSAAAYRLGHSMVRNKYLLNDNLGTEIPIFSTSGQDLRGFRKLPDNHTVQWDKFLKFHNVDDSGLQFSRKLDTKLSRALGALPIAGNNPLAELNLIRGYRMQLPSGQDVARKMGIMPNHANNHDPLWFYILDEAEQDQSGEQLGTLGAHLIAEVFVGLLAADPSSYLNVNPRWTPFNEARFPIPHHNGIFLLRDIVDYAEMPITQADL